MSSGEAPADVALPLGPEARARLRRGDALALFTVVIWGATLPVAKPIVAAVDPFVYAAARFWVIGLGLLLVAALSGENLRLRASDLPFLILLGLLGFGVVQTLTALALAQTNASKGSVIMATVPAWGALFGRLKGERGSAMTWFGIGVAFAGVFLLINNSVTSLRLIGGTMQGDAMFVVSAALFALYTALSRRALIRHGAVKAGAYMTLFGSAFMLVPAWWGARHGPVWPADPKLWLNFAFVALGSGTLGFATWYTAVAILGITRALLYNYLIPLVGVLGAVLFLHEPFSAVQAVGGVLVLIGVALAR